MQFWLITQFTEMDQLEAIARRADEMGVHGLALGDHLAAFERQNDEYLYTEDGQPLWDSDTHWPDPWVQTAALAAVTKSLKFMTAVYVLPMHETFSAAKAIGTAAYLSKGRVILGIGTGWQRAEFDLVQRGFNDRGKIIDEQLEVMKKLWSGEMVEHHGQYHDFDRLRMSPAPGAPIPIYGGGLAPVALRRSAQLEGWIGPKAYLFEEIQALVSKVQRARLDAGKSTEDYELIFTCKDINLDNVKRLEDIGVNGVMLCPWLRGRAEPSMLSYKLQQMDRFAEYFKL